MMKDIMDSLHELTDSAVSEQTQLHSLLTQFIENETRSCSMDFGCITPEYVYRMLGGEYSMEEIKEALSACMKEVMRDNNFTSGPGPSRR